MCKYLAGSVDQMLRMEIVISGDNLGFTTIKDQLALLWNGEFATACFNVNMEPIIPSILASDPPFSVTCYTYSSLSSEAVFQC